MSEKAKTSAKQAQEVEGDHRVRCQSQLVLDEKEIDGRRRCNLVAGNIPFDFAPLVCPWRDSALGLATNPPFEVVPGRIGNVGECSRTGTHQ